MEQALLRSGGGGQDGERIGRRAARYLRGRR
jgi:hypothetical protein